VPATGGAGREGRTAGGLEHPSRSSLGPLNPSLYRAPSPWPVSTPGPGMTSRAGPARTAGSRSSRRTRGSSTS